MFAFGLSTNFQLESDNFEKVLTFARYAFAFHFHVKQARTVSEEILRPL